MACVYAQYRHLRASHPLRGAQERAVASEADDAVDVGTREVVQYNPVLRDVVFQQIVREMTGHIYFDAVLVEQLQEFRYLRQKGILARIPVYRYFHGRLYFR